MTPEVSAESQQTQSPLELTEEDHKLIERVIGTKSVWHGDYYARTFSEGTTFETEIWHLVRTCLGKEKGKAISRIRSGWESFSEKEALAVWLFFNAFPETAKELAKRHSHNDWPEEDRIAHPAPTTVLNLTP